MIWDTSCRDWEDRIINRRSLVPRLPLIEAEAERAIRVFNRLRIPDVAGKPAMGEAAGDWFREIVAALFGSYDEVTNTRHIQELFLLVPKKNAKSTGAGALMVTATILNRRPNAEFVFIAPTKEIADIAYGQAAGMIAADPELAKRYHSQKHIRTITHRTSDSTLKIKAADTDAITGSKATGTLIDETHVFAAHGRAAEVFVELRGALAARPDGFLIQITTQSKSPPAGVFASELRKARDVRDGKRKLPLLPVLYEYPGHVIRSGDWKNPAFFPMVNPNLGRSVNPDFLIREYETAVDGGPEPLALFASQHLNVEIGLALRSDRWAGADFWQGAAEQTLTLDELIARSEVITVGIDGGGLDDLLGFAVIGREHGTRRWLHWAHAWAHQSVLERRKSEAPRLLDFERDGDLTIVRTLGQDTDDIAETVSMIDGSGKLASVGLDPVGIGAIVDALAEQGIEGDRVVGITQGWKLAGAIKTAERKLADGSLCHTGSPLMAWCVGNARVEPRGNAIMITKQIAGTGKIDPLMATFNAVALMATNPESEGSVYETPERAAGLLVI